MNVFFNWQAPAGVSAPQLYPCPASNSSTSWEATLESSGCQEKPGLLLRIQGGQGRQKARSSTRLKPGQWEQGVDDKLPRQGHCANPGQQAPSFLTVASQISPVQG